MNVNDLIICLLLLVEQDTELGNIPVVGESEDEGLVEFTSAIVYNKKLVLE